MTIKARNNVNVLGDPSKPVLLFAHGFGCSQLMWSALSQSLKDDTYQVLFDYVGSGQSDINAYSMQRYETLHGYALDIIDICDELSLAKDVIFVGHSVSCSIGILAANLRPALFKKMILLGPSPRFLNDPPDYHGGFEKSDLEGLLQLMDQNYLGWASYLAPVVAGPDSDPQISGQLSDSFCSTDPIIARQFAQATFFADNRDDFARLTVPSLILQHKQDVLASMAVGEYVHSQLVNSELVVLDVAGHAAHMSHPHLVEKALRDFLKLSQ